MPSSTSPSPLNPSNRPWRFTWETLAHIPTLRLYLFRSPAPTSLSDLSASIQIDRQLLFVSLSYQNGDIVRLEVPVPKVLIEPDKEIQCTVKDDHVEIKLSLVLPVDHPVVIQYRASVEFNGDEKAVPIISLNDDLKSLSSGDVDLYCKSCSNKLTKQPLKHIVQMPSLNWRDVADNWFGNCCCSFGAAAENLVTQYLNSINLSSEIGLLNSTSITVSKDSIHGYSSNSDSQEPSLNLPEAKCTKPEYDRQNIYLGGGFVHNEANISKDVEWVEFCCEKCLSPLGSYPCQKDMANTSSIDGGVRLFKCYISTSTPVGGLGDVFRYYTVQNLFSNLLLESAEEEVSFRTVVRDLKSRKPVLQLVLLSSKAWYFSGTCIENRAVGPDRQVELKQFAKVLFSACSDDASETDIKSVENWSTKYDAEEVYMMTHQIEELKKGLILGKQSLPLSCSFLQGMHLSWLDLQGY